MKEDEHVTGSQERLFFDCRWAVVTVSNVFAGDITGFAAFLSARDEFLPSTPVARV